MNAAKAACVIDVSLAEGQGGEPLETLLGEAGALRVRILEEDLGLRELRTDVFGDAAGLAGTMADDAAAARDSRRESPASSPPSSPSNDGNSVGALPRELGWLCALFLRDGDRSDVRLMPSRVLGHALFLSIHLPNVRRLPTSARRALWPYWRPTA